MINVILNGYNGKMGRAITEIITQFPLLKIVAGIDKYPSQGQNFPVFSSIDQCDIAADVILDFSRPESLESLLNYSKLKKLSLVLCTTGYTPEQLISIEKASCELPIFRSANMSIGINIVNSILRQISGFLYDNYDIEIIEKHHNQKVDSPSGTALLLANTIKEVIKEEIKFINGREGNRKREHNEIGIHAVRGGSIVGDHEVIFAGQGEIIEIKHSALSREVFAVGALKACEFMYDKKPGLYNMDAVVNQK
jgi:4-hydroxy-tetrahydrodipicolinate reductase